ncbi:MAG: thymidine phosphorylase [Clostridiales bacterium]|nr:thymidine phosphorylase [Clostridiales bacterium]
MPTPVDIIQKKRLGKALNREEIEQFVRGCTDGSFADYQTAALLMAICINGMNAEETRDLTMAMAHSGDMLDLSSLSGPTVDKHSTGGVGDTTSLILVPLVAACGAKVAKMSGRGLGFTGGTLDKIESIPGANPAMEIDDFIRTVETIGCAIISQTGDLAPADKVLYALRDVTATVDSLPLIVSSILSKKLASGAQNIVLDVKSGSGALMETLEKSEELARMLVNIGNATGRHFCALVTDMNQPLGMNIGNALEVREAIEILAGKTGGALKEVSLDIGTHMLRLAGFDRPRERIEEALTSGAGLKKLAEMIEALGGDPRVCEDISLLPQAEKIIPVPAPESGWICSMTACDIGRASIALGAGRIQKSDKIDPAVGIIMTRRIGESIEKGEPVAFLHANPASDVESAKKLLLNAIRISKEPVETPPLVYAVIE